MRLSLLALVPLFFLSTCCVHAPVMPAQQEDLSAETMQCLAPEPVPEPPPENPVPRIVFAGPVTKESVDSAMTTLDAVVGARAVLFEINSSGGDVDAGFLLAKSIEEWPGAVVCVVDGEAMSQAFYILQSCDVRLMTRRSMLMVHEPYFKLVLGSVDMTRGYLAQMRKKQDVLAKGWTEHAGARMKIGVAGLRKRIKWSDWHMAADEALGVGAVDDLVPSVMDAWILLSAQIERER